MPTLTHNLFWGSGPGEHRLRVVEGTWPSDVDGDVFIVGPDKRAPGGHWFAEQGMICRIGCAPDTDGAIPVVLRRVETTVSRWRARLPFLFTKRWLLELSPFGFTNFANTNVQPIDERLFVGYDVGRPIEVDPETLDVITPVGANDEWLQMLPAPFEPMVSVAAHPAPAPEEHALYFVNYCTAPLDPETPGTWIARWALDGPVERWRLDIEGAYDSIHDVKATRDHLVIADLPFRMEPQALRGGERTRPNQTYTRLWIVAKADLRATPPGARVPVREVRLPLPTGHLLLDPDPPTGQIVVWTQHIPLQDLTMTIDRRTRSHATGALIDPNYAGLIALAVQPGCVGRYRIDVASGRILEQATASDAERFWGGVLWTQEVHRDDAPPRPRQMWHSGMGFDPELVPEPWWRLYGSSPHGLVAPDALPREAKPGVLVSIDLEAMKIGSTFAFPDGAFPHPPTFVPRREPRHAGDGYVVVVVHGGPPKEVWIFDAAAIERGPLARATTPDFNPPLMLHSCWMAPRKRGRASTYRVSAARDAWGALRALPRKLVHFARLGVRMARGEEIEGLPK